MGLTAKQRAFIEEYLSCWNATEAARRLGYKHPNMAGPRLILKDSVKTAIQERISEKAMGADEVLIRLAAMARGDMGDFLDIGSMGFTVDLEKAQEKGLTQLIKKVDLRTETSMNKDGVETETHNMKIELYDAQAALVHLGRRHGLFVDRTDITTGGKELSIPDERFDRAISTLADALRESLPGKSDQPQGAVDATEQTAVVGAPKQGG